ncbi:hypothetical protein L195_g032979, partial [Trifolium pratense]
MNPDVDRVMCHGGKVTRRISDNKYLMLPGYLDKSWRLTRPTTYNGDTSVFKGRFYALNQSQTIVVGPDVEY